MSLKDENLKLKVLLSEVHCTIVGVAVVQRVFWKCQEVLSELTIDTIFIKLNDFPAC